MKSILLASASIVAFTIAGAAAAEVTFGGEVTLGFNDDDDDVEDDQDGFYFSGNLAVTLTQMLDNGVTASATFDFDFVEVESGGSDGTSNNGLGLDLESGGFLLSLTSETAGLYFGDTTFAAETYWSGVGETAEDSFSEADGEIVLRGEAMFGGFTGGMSYVVGDADGNLVGDDPTLDASVDQFSAGGVFEGGNFSVGFAYQAESEVVGAPGCIAGEVCYDPWAANGDFTPDEIFGVFGSFTVANAEISAAYANNATTEENSTGIGISYPFGPVTVGATYAMNSSDAEDDIYTLTLGYANGPITVDAEYENSADDKDDSEDDASFSVDAVYQVYEGFDLHAGFNGGDTNFDEDGDENLDYYFAIVYAFGEGATITASYAVDEDDSEGDEIGGPEFQEGTTVEVSFEF